MCVNAFHGYSHEYSCQIQYHPTYIEGTGLEDLETMERLFSHSNQLAPVIRYATAYRRRALMDVLFEQWDWDKYLNLGKMLYENYRQALAIIKEQTPVLAGAMQSLNVTRADLERFTTEERAYLATLGKETSEDLREILYVEKLQELRDVVQVSPILLVTRPIIDVTCSTQLARANRQYLAGPQENFNVTFLPPSSGPTNYDAETSKTRKLETNRRYLDERRKLLSLEVTELEVQLGIGMRWQPGNRDYVRVARYIATRTYQRALANLQRLIVQRLFELHKMNLAQTEHANTIACHTECDQRVQHRRGALDPPRPKLEWETISHYHFIEEFNLLNDTRADIREKPWAQPAMRETLRVARRLARAQEELIRVEVEARRVHTHIRDEDSLLKTVLDDLAAKKDPIYGPVSEYATRRRAAHAYVLTSLKKLYAIPEFSGDPMPGTHIDAAVPTASAEPDPQGLQAEDGELYDDKDEDVAEGEEDEEIQEQITSLADTSLLRGLEARTRSAFRHGRILCQSVFGPSHVCLLVAVALLPRPFTHRIYGFAAYCCIEDSPRNDSDAKPLAHSQYQPPSCYPLSLGQTTRMAQDSPANGHDLLNGQHVRPIYVVLGKGPEAGIHNERNLTEHSPPNVALGRHVDILPLVVVTYSQLEASKVAQLNDEIIAPLSDPSDVEDLRQRILRSQTVKRIFTQHPGRIHALKVASETGIYHGMDWDAIKPFTKFQGLLGA
ncbi:hypothetical protein NUW54_g10941 [Trametes sanguinea]|uniref:Uncharacterized protein n=1 Tax=Trametes sanguinea TaxID=158606 RepID=A0ACC1NPS5_9APHY|nr:hypothetical protein NUW54_g10941 [Trametes sanguinea]